MQRWRLLNVYMTVRSRIYQDYIDIFWKRMLTHRLDSPFLVTALLSRIQASPMKNLCGQEKLMRKEILPFCMSAQQSNSICIVSIWKTVNVRNEVLMVYTVCFGPLTTNFPSNGRKLELFFSIVCHPSNYGTLRIGLNQIRSVYGWRMRLRNLRSNTALSLSIPFGMPVYHTPLILAVDSSKIVCEWRCCLRPKSKWLLSSGCHTSVFRPEIYALWNNHQQ